jgi:prevent-host-death family protein
LLIRKAEKGDAIALTRRGAPVAVLVSNDTCTKLTTRKTDLGLALDEFRRDFDLVELNVEEIYRDVRDRPSAA